MGPLFIISIVVGSVTTGYFLSKIESRLNKSKDQERIESLEEELRNEKRNANISLERINDLKTQIRGHKEFSEELKTLLEANKKNIKILESELKNKSIEYISPKTNIINNVEEIMIKGSLKNIGDYLKKEMASLEERSKRVRITASFFASRAFYEKNYNGNGNLVNFATDHLYIGSPSKIADEMSDFIKDPNLKLYKEGSPLIDDGLVSIFMKVSYVDYEVKYPKEKIIKDILVNYEVKVVENKVLEVKKPESKTEASIEDLVAAQVEVELALRKNVPLEGIKVEKVLN